MLFCRAADAAIRRGDVFLIEPQGKQAPRVLLEACRFIFGALLLHALVMNINPLAMFSGASIACAVFHLGMVMMVLPGNEVWKRSFVRG